MKKNMTMNTQEMINDLIKKPNGKSKVKILPDLQQLLFTRLNEVQGTSWYPFILRDVRRKLLDIQEKEQKGLIKPI